MKEYMRKKKMKKYIENPMDTHRDIYALVNESFDEAERQGIDLGALAKKEHDEWLDKNKEKILASVRKYIEEK